jgi:hypothetical protein
MYARVKKNYVLGQIITVLKNPILTLPHKTAHCTYGQACNPRILSRLSNLSKGRLTTLSCLTVMHVIVGLACLLQFIKTESNHLFFQLGELRINIREIPKIQPIKIVITSINR